MAMMEEKRARVDRPAAEWWSRSTHSLVAREVLPSVRSHPNSISTRRKCGCGIECTMFQNWLAFAQPDMKKRTLLLMSVYDAI
jgi:hypothetical protein